MIPLYCFLQGDTVGLLILAREEQSVGELAQQLQEAASVRVQPRPSVTVVHRGRALDATWTVRQAGMAPLDRVDVRVDVVEGPPP